MTAENRGWEQLLGDVTSAKREIQDHKGDEINTAELAELAIIVAKMFQESNVTYGGETLPLNPTILGKLRERSGSVTRGEALAVTDELRKYLRKLEDEAYNHEPEPKSAPTGGAFGQGAFGAFAFGGGPNGPTGPVTSEPLNTSALNSGPRGPTAGGPTGTMGVDSIAPTASTNPTIVSTSHSVAGGSSEIDDTISSDVSVNGPGATVQTKETANGRITRIILRTETWISVPSNHQVKDDIKRVSELLENILSKARGSNVMELDQLVTDLDKAQLIAILQTAIDVLKAPMVPQSFLARLSDALQEGAINAAKDKAQLAIGTMMGLGAAELRKLIVQLSS